MFKFWIKTSLVILVFIVSFLIFAPFFVNFDTKTEPISKKEPSFISLAPAMTEIMYKIGAEDMLLAVSSYCDYPLEVKEKEKIGSTYLINIERILQLKPVYILGPDSSEFLLTKFKRFGITPVCDKYPDIESVYGIILKLGELAGKNKEAKIAAENLRREIEAERRGKGRKILYLVQTEPMITIGKKSFIDDIIQKSGNASVTSGLKFAYPVISEEFALKQNPDIIVIGEYGDDIRVKKLFPNTKIIKIPDELSTIVSRPGPRLPAAVKFFASL